jgi:hypothetical protein
VDPYIDVVDCQDAYAFARIAEFVAGDTDDEAFEPPDVGLLLGEGRTVLAASLKGRLVGYALLARESLEWGDYSILHCVSVPRSFDRGRGYGAELVRASVAHFAARGHDRVVAQIRADRGDWWSTMGWRVLPAGSDYWLAHDRVAEMGPLRVRGGAEGYPLVAVWRTPGREFTAVDLAFPWHLSVSDREPEGALLGLLDEPLPAYVGPRVRTALGDWAARMEAEDFPFIMTSGRYVP